MKKRDETTAQWKKRNQKHRNCAQNIGCIIAVHTALKITHTHTHIHRHEQEMCARMSTDYFIVGASAQTHCEDDTRITHLIHWWLYAAARYVQYKTWIGKNFRRIDLPLTFDVFLRSRLNWPHSWWELLPWRVFASRLFFGFTFVLFHMKIILLLSGSSAYVLTWLLHVN